MEVAGESIQGPRWGVECKQSEVDGVPLFWAEDDGPMHAGLVFRVGRADESLARGGITHLVEHLALHPISAADPHVNGATSPLTTTFYVHGGPDEVTRFLGTVTSTLQNLPVERLEVERAILRTEAGSRSRGPREALLAWRHGPASFGLTAFDEFGLHCLGDEAARAWAARWFTRQNAAIWLVGKEIPSDLRLDLLDGVRMPVADATSVLPRFPAFINGPINGVALDAVVDNSMAARLFAEVFERKMHVLLRRELGLSYQTLSNFDRRDADTALITIYADALPEKQDEVVGPLLDLLRECGRDAELAAELSAVKDDGLAALGDDRNPLPMVMRAATRSLVGDPGDPFDRGAMRDRLEAVTVEDLREVARRVLSTALAVVPDGHGIGRAGFTPAPVGSSESVAGKEFTPADWDTNRKLIVGEHGVSVIEGINVHTVHFRDCQALLEYPDGARRLIGPDATSVRIEPNLWRLAPGTIEQIDQSIDPERVVPMPERSADEVPEAPEVLPPSQPKIPPAKSAARWSQAQGILVALLAVGVIVLAVAGQVKGAVLPLLAGAVIAYRIVQRRGSIR